METTEYLILPLLQAFCWFDDGLQASLAAKGWDQVTRPQSMVMINVLAGHTKASAIARNLGISRQAAHVTLQQLQKLGMVEIVDDPADGRAKTVVISGKGLAMRVDADEAVTRMTAELRRRIGARHVEALFKAFSAEWGEPPVIASRPAAHTRGKGARG